MPHAHALCLCPLRITHNILPIPKPLWTRPLNLNNVTQNTPNHCQIRGDQSWSSKVEHCATGDDTREVFVGTAVDAVLVDIGRCAGLYDD